MPLPKYETADDKVKKTLSKLDEYIAGLTTEEKAVLEEST